MSEYRKDAGRRHQIAHTFPTRLLIIDDDTELCQLAANYFQPKGFEVEIKHGAELTTSEQWAAFIRDVMMLGYDSIEVLRRIRARSKVPVMMLTGRVEEVVRMVGLELGADDYLPKTFSSRELLARLRALLRRTGWIAETAPQAPVKELVIGELRLTPETQAVVLGAEPLQLTLASLACRSHSPKRLAVSKPASNPLRRSPTANGMSLTAPSTCTSPPCAKTRRCPHRAALHRDRARLRLPTRDTLTISRLKLPLYGKILFWFLVNMVVLAASGLRFMGAQFRLGLDWMLAGPGGDRLETRATTPI